MSRRWRIWVIVPLAAACQVVSGVGDLEFVDEDPDAAAGSAGVGGSAGSAGNGGGAGSGGSAGSGGGDACVPKTCADLAADCGSIDDGCGNALDCGGCIPPEVCNASHQCECTPQGCADIECGGAPDGCGGTVICGDCGGHPSGPYCGGNGPNKCGPTPCTPTTCSSQSVQCGTTSDGCGSTLNCGACNQNEVCVTGQCKKQNGTACSNASDCASGFCPMPEGVCCESACNGLCMRCKDTGFPDGQCWPVFENTDPDNECAGGRVCHMGSTVPACTGVNVCDCGTPKYNQYASCCTTCGANECPTAINACNNQHGTPCTVIGNIDAYNIGGGVPDQSGQCGSGQRCAIGTCTCVQ